MEWETGLLILSTTNLMIILSIMVFLFIRTTSSRFSRRHLLFSQLGLLGMLMGSSLGFAFVIQPSDVTCVAIRLGTGLSYVLIYASIMVKQVFLMALSTGIYLPVLYQILLFSFCVLVQIVISFQWLVMVPLCQFNSQDHILSLFYIFFLVFFITMISIRSLGMKNRSRQSSSICLLMIITISSWIIWMIAGSLLPTIYHNAAFGKNNIESI